MKKDASCKIPRWQLLKAQLNNLSPLAFQEKINQTIDPIIIDCRSEKEYAISHINGAINIDFMMEYFWEEVTRLPKTATIFVYCQIGRKSIRACTLMKNGGFDGKNIVNLDTGYKEWNKEMQISK